MVAETRSRRKGIATEALMLVMAFGVTQLVRRLVPPCCFSSRPQPVPRLLSDWRACDAERHDVRRQSPGEQPGINLLPAQAGVPRGEAGSGVRRDPPGAGCQRGRRAGATCCRGSEHAYARIRGLQSGGCQRSPEKLKYITSQSIILAYSQRGSADPRQHHRADQVACRRRLRRAVREWAAVPAHTRGALPAPVAPQRSPARALLAGGLVSGPAHNNSWEPMARTKQARPVGVAGRGRVLHCRSRAAVAQCGCASDRVRLRCAEPVQADGRQDGQEGQVASEAAGRRRRQ